MCLWSLSLISWNYRWNRDKLSTTVRFPLDALDLKNHVKKPGGAQLETVGNDWLTVFIMLWFSCHSLSNLLLQLYDCYAVSNHFGALGGGHYTAFARSLTSGVSSSILYICLQMNVLQGNGWSLTILEHAILNSRR